MNQERQNIITAWFSWHFFQMPAFLFSVWQNYLLFGLDFFSVPLLLATLFAPWKRYNWQYPKHFNPIEYLNTFISNIFSRVIGAVLRIVLMGAGIIASVLIFIAGAIAIVLWLILPFVLIAVILYGLII